MTIDKNTLIFGSFSSNPGNNGCIFFNSLFDENNINAIYKSFYSEDIEKSYNSAKNLGFGGFAVSMPFKFEIVKIVDELDSSAEIIGAANTVVFKDNKSIAYNTDWIAVKRYLEELNIKAIGNLYDIASKKKKSNQEFEIDLGNGSTRWVLASMNQSNTAKQYILVVHDITQLRKLDSMRRDFISNVSHELRTPVSVIMANSETLLSGALDNKADAENFSKAILHNAERLSEMVSDLIDLSRIEYGELKLEFEKVNINQSILKALDAIKGLAAKKEISLNFDEYDDEFIRVDINAIDRILINLLDNAIKYSPNKSSVSITIEDKNSHIEVNVTDSGKGIDDSDKSRIFGRFYRTAQARASDKTGSGLGLAIVKNLVHSLDGDVGVRNSNSGGSNFWFTVPKA